jgi:hypothetical protein|tara:strand:+ start:706 stop:1821 length:1116 start_codon:yes stop_codon:yes gene_type:complete
VVKRKRNVKKTKGVTYKTSDGTEITLEIDRKAFRDAYNTWVRKAESLVGDEIGVISPEASGKNLLSFIQDQGVVGRVKGKMGTKIKGQGGVQIFKALQTIFNTGMVLEKQKEALKKLDSTMTAIQGTDADPRNISFSNPTNWDDDDGTVLSTKKVYGHYRTDEYEIVRELKGEDVPAKDGFFSGSKDTAKPPMWQALYGDGNSSPFNSPSLHTIIKQAIKDLEGTATIGKDNPVPIDGAKAATTALTISVIRQIIDSALDKGRGTSGSFPDKAIQSVIQKQPFDIRTEKDSKAVKTLKRLNIPNDIEECWFKISRRQVKRMAAIRAKEKGIAMHYKMTSGDVARSPLKFGERPEPDDEKKSFDSWQDMLVI